MAWKSIIYQMSSSFCYKVVTIVFVLRPVSRTTSQPAGHIDAMPCTSSPPCKCKNAKYDFKILHIIFQELVRKFEVCLSTIHPVFTILVSVVLSWAPMAVKYVLKRYDEHDV
jgi:hypothetical protein